MTAGAVVIRTVGLEKKYGERAAVRSLDLEVRQGEVFGLLGPNGAGKTSLLRIASLWEHPTRGTVRVFGETLGNPGLEVMDIQAVAGVAHAHGLPLAIASAGARDGPWETSLE